MPLLINSAQNSGKPSRIVNVSSVAHTFPRRFDVLDVNLAKSSAYSALGWTAYGNSKLANVLFTYELHRRLRSAGIECVNVNAVHPGVVDSELPRNLSINFYPLFRFLGQLITTEEGARGQVALSIGDVPYDVSGAYFTEMSASGKRGVHEIAESSALSKDIGLQRAFFDESCRLTCASWDILNHVGNSVYGVKSRVS